jgi:hypothetical protein
MVPSDRERLLAEFNCNPPAGIAVIRQFEAESRVGLPEDYKEFLKQANGGEGFVGDAYVVLWRVEELLEMNKGYGVDEFAPGLFLFGSDGGGEGFAFDTRSDAKPIVKADFICMEDAVPMASNFKAFLEELFKS